jgi:hypothetical protein
MNKFQKVGRVKNVKSGIITPENVGLCFILTLSNMAGTQDHPLFKVLDKKWGKARSENRIWFINKTGAYKPGAINDTAVQSDVWIIHMLCQDANKKTDLEGLKICLNKIVKSALEEKASLHVSSLLIDTIPELPQMLEDQVVQNGINVFYYND